MARSLIPTLPDAGLTGMHMHRGPEWRPYPLLPEGDAHDDTDDADKGDDDTDDADDGDAKGDADDKGDKELTAAEWQAKFEAQQRISRDLERRTKRDKAALDRLNAQAAGKGKGADDKVDPDKIREEARAEASAAVLRDRVLDKIEAKAGARFDLDPEDVAALVLRRAKDGADEFIVDGKVDAQAIEDALAALLEARPKLAAQGGKRFQGGADAGHRKGDQSGKPKQLTKSDVDRMYAARQYDEIDKARADGQLADLLSGKS